MKQEFLKTQLVEGGINRFSEEYNVGTDVKNIGKNRRRNILTTAIVFCSCLTLAAVLGTRDQDPLERARMHQETIAQQSAYRDSVSDSLKVAYEGE